MKFLETLHTDFRLFDATASTDEVEELLPGLRCSYVVVRSDDSERGNYFAYEPSDLLESLREARNAAPEAGATSIREALQLGDKPTWATVPTTQQEPPATKSIVLDGRGPVGIYFPRGGARDIKPPVLPPATGSSSAATNADQVTRALRARMPKTVPPNTAVKLRVSLAELAEPNSGDETFSAALGTSLLIAVVCSGALKVTSRDNGMLEVADPQPATALEFDMLATQPGTASVCVLAFHAGAVLARVQLNVSVEAAHDAEPPAETSASAHCEVVPGRLAPDLTLNIIERDEELEFFLNTADADMNFMHFGPVPLKIGARTYCTQLFADIDAAPGQTKLEKSELVRRLRTAGSNLYDALFPNDLRIHLWALRERVKTVQISSDEPWLPWELCRMQTTGEDGRIIGGPFFAEAFAITRWIPGVGAPRTFSLGNMALVVTEDSELPAAAAETEYLSGLASQTRKVTRLVPTYKEVTNAMVEGTYDAWHFVGHARADAEGNADRSHIVLNKQTLLRSGEIAGEVSNVLLPRPFVFLNACQSAQGGLSLTGAGGWAKRLVQPSPNRLPGQPKKTAAVFIGSYWSVSDDKACAFARELYRLLLEERKPIGEAVQLARQSIYSEDDATWLAYTVYADPLARVAAC